MSEALVSPFVASTATMGCVKEKSGGVVRVSTGEGVINTGTQFGAGAEVAECCGLGNKCRDSV